MVIAVGANEEDLSAKTGQAIQQATLKLQNLRETISKHGEMERDVRQQELLVVERERGREKRIEELDREIRVAGDMLQVCLDEREGVKVELEKARKDAEVC